jgi:Carboxypeptidase regulatory-like domain
MRKIVRAVCLLLCICGGSWAQSSTATVHGTVTDSTNAVIPAASVTLTGTETGVERKTVTNESGLFAFAAVIPGPYRIKVESPGMQSYEANLTVQVQVDAVVNAVLSVGQSAVRVEVQDVTPLVQTSSPSLGQFLERQRIEQLPVNGRGYQNLLVTVPAVTWQNQGFGIGGLVRGYGMQAGSTTLTFDGAAQNEVWEGWDVARTPDLDTIAEMQVETNNSSAKFTRPTTIVMSSKSGTNQVHGALFYTNRNSGYGVARAREDTFTKPPYLNRNEFGGSVGGPVYVPKVYNGHNRTFFFFSWEDIRSLTYTTRFSTVPTQAMRNGDFRGITDSQGRPYNFYDPYTTNANTWSRQQLSYNGIPNMIDPSRESPLAKTLFAITPLPNLPAVNPLVGQNWVGPIPRVLRQEVKNIRIDHRISSRDLLWGRFSYGSHYEEYQYPNLEKLNHISDVDTRWWPNFSVSTNWVHTFGTSLTNELLMTGTRDFQRRGSGDFKTNYASTVLGLPNPFNAPNWPNITGTDLGTGSTGFAFGSDGLFYLITNAGTLQDNATKIKGSHEFQFGFQFKLEDVPKNVSSLAGDYDFGTLATAAYDPSSTAQNPIAQPLTGLGVANMYLGVANYAARFNRPEVYMRRKEYAFYFQDNWKLTRKLTVNLGLRWEYRTPVYERTGALMGFDVNQKAYVLGTDVNTFQALGNTLPSIVSGVQNYGGKIITYDQAGLPKNLVYNNWRNFGPRLGFAYRAFEGKKAFVIRGGYRISYYTEPISNWFNSQSNAQLVSATFLNSVSDTSVSPDGLPNYGLRSVPQYVAGVNTPSSIININDTRTLPRGFSAYFLDPHMRDPQVQDWNLTVEKEIMANSVVRATFLGNHTSNLLQQVDLNDSTPAYIWYATRKQPLPNGPFASVATRPYDQQVWGNVNEYRTTGWENFSGAQLEFERRFSQGIGFQAFWVLANTFAAASRTTVPSVNTYLNGAVPTDFDQLNRFLNYQRDTTAPKQSIRWNWVAELPFGKGKALFGNAHGVMDKLIGGWQLAGTGQWRTNYFALPASSSSIYPTGTPIEEYGYKYPIQDCRSGICYPGYLYWNGYIPANQINSHDANGRPNGVMGVPANYKPAGAPLIPWGTTTLPPNAPANTNLSTYWDTNTVWVPLDGSAPQRTTFNNNLHPWRNQYLKGPNQWFLDASLFKFVGITDRVRLRFAVDFFNVLNNPNDPNPGTATIDGILPTRTSGSPPRVTQLSLRLNW